MRYLSKLNVLGGFALFSILIALSLLYASDFYTVGNPLTLSAGQTSQANESAFEVPKIPSDADHRLVVFGDAWSDTGSRLAAQGQAWPEWFCMMWPCRLESYAQKNQECKSAFCGSVVDEAELHTVDSDISRSLEPLPDLRSQIDQWLAAEINAAQEDPEGGDVPTRSINTVFALSFLIWDIYKFQGIHLGDAKDSIQRSIGTLFQQLDRLAEHTGPDDLRILLLMSVDPTFLPAFDPSQGQKDMVSVASQWNKELKEQADKWKNGSIYIFNTNEFLTNQIKSQQFYMAGILDGHGLGKENLWDDVENPCVQTKSNWLPFLSDKDERCAHPEKFLFWDGLHLGPAANQVMSKKIFHDIDGLWIKKENSTDSNKEHD